MTYPFLWAFGLAVGLCGNVSGQDGGLNAHTEAAKAALQPQEGNQAKQTDVFITRLAVLANLQAQQQEELARLKKEESKLTRQIADIEKRLAFDLNAANDGLGYGLFDQDYTQRSRNGRLANYRDLATEARPDVPPFWIGVQCEPLEYVPLQSAHDEFGQVFFHGGLSVSAVTEGSPAAKAMVKVGDVIIIANKKRTPTIQKLMNVIGQAGEEEVVLQVIREKKPMQFKVKPAKRPTTPGNATGYTFTREAPAGWTAYPEGLELKIVRQQKSPEIYVAWKDQKWVIPKDKIHELPREIRAHVQRVHLAVVAWSGNAWSTRDLWDVESLKSDPRTSWFYSGPKGDYRVAWPVPHVPQTGVPGNQQHVRNMNSPGADVARQLKQLQEQVKALEKAVRELD